MFRALRLVVLGAGLALGVGGCQQADPNSNAYWIEKLKTEDRRAAIRKLGELRATEAVDALVEAYKDNRHRYEIVAALAQIGAADAEAAKKAEAGAMDGGAPTDVALPTTSKLAPEVEAARKKAVAVMLEALLDTNEAKAGQLAANALLEWGEKDHVDTYVNVLNNKSIPRETVFGVLKIIAQYPDARATDALLKMLEGDPDLQPIAFNGLAAEALGKLQEPKAISGLVQCLWLDDHLHRNEVPRCRLAVNRVGPKVAVPLLIQTLERKNRQVEQRARKYQYDKGGLIEAKCAELLSDMPDPSAVPALLAALTTKEEMPVSIQADPNKAQAFVMSGVQKVISIANALAVIGDAKAVGPLTKIAADKELALEHKLAAVQQLAFLGSKDAIAPLKALLDNEPNVRDPVSQGFRIQIALNLANLVDGTDLKLVDDLEKQIQGIKAKFPAYQADLGKEVQEAKAKVAELEAAKAEAEKKADTSKEGQDKLKELKRQVNGWKRGVEAVEADIKAFDQWAKEYDEALAKLAAVRECTDDPTCWGKKFEDKSEAVRMMAGYRLAQMSSKRDTALAELAKVIGTEDLVLRNLVFFGLDRLGDKSIVPALEKARVADAERAKKDKRFAGAVYTLELMIAKLGHK